MINNKLRVDFQRDWYWQAGFLPEVSRLLLANAMYIFNVEVASAQQDMKEATDMLLSVAGQKKVAIRLRRAEYWKRDLTIRSVRSSGMKTELEKIQAGHGDLYLYGWTHDLTISEWMLIDLHKLRASGLLAHYGTIRNRDRATGFVAIPYYMLRDYGCVLNARVLR